MTVFVVQNAQRKNMHVAGATHPVYDLMPALKFGELAFLLPPGRMVDIPYSMYRLKVRLASYTDDDYLLCIGDPVAIGAACMVAAKLNKGRVNLLSWDRDAKHYTPMQLDLEANIHD